MAEAAILGIVCAVAKKAGEKAAEIAVSQITKESSRLSQVREDLIWIETEMRCIQSYLKDADAKRVKTEGVSNFIREIRDLAYDVEDIIDTYFPKIRLHRSRWKRLLDFTNMRIARGFVKEVEDIKRRVENLKNVRQTFGIEESSRNNEEVIWDSRKTFPHLDEPNVLGFDNLIEDLVQKVIDKDSHHHVVSIVGSPGLGKTTLARKVYNSARQSELFNCAAWVCVSDSPNVQKLLQDIAGQVGLEKEKIELNVEINLSEFLKTRRYVIVIDDIWRSEVWNALKDGLPKKFENGSRIILTSRNRDVGVHVGGQNSVLKLKPLDRETSRELFNKIISGDSQDNSETQDPPQLKKTGEKILERCGGVPLAIVLAGGLLKLRDRSETAWKGVLENVGLDNDQCAEIFALSYKDLPLNLKPCFLYFGIFPEDHEIEAFDLINLWAAEGFIKRSSVREVEEVGDDYLNQLIARNLIQVVEKRRYNGRVKSVRIHDVMHHLCIRVAKEINFFSIHTNEINCNTALKLRRVTGHDPDIDYFLALYPKTSNLRAVFNFARHQGPFDRGANKNPLQQSKFLQVLVDLQSDYTKRLWDSYLTDICNLSQLTYLKLGSQGKGLISDAPSLPRTISNLKSLLTLDLRNLRDVYLPNVIWSMKQLRHILLPRHPIEISSWVNLDVFKSNPIEISLPNLQTFDWLPGEIFKADWLHKLTSLRTLHVNQANEDHLRVLSDATPVSDMLEELFVDGFMLYFSGEKTFNFSRYDNLFALHIESIKLTEFSHDRLPPNLSELTLVKTSLKTDPMEALKKLEKLKFLKLDKYAYEGEEIVCSGEPGDFSQLEVLEIGYMENLKMLVVEEEGMPRLKDLWINCLRVQTQVPERVGKVMRIDYVR